MRVDRKRSIVSGACSFDGPARSSWRVDATPLPRCFVERCCPTTSKRTSSRRRRPREAAFVSTAGAGDRAHASWPRTTRRPLLRDCIVITRRRGPSRSAAERVPEHRIACLPIRTTRTTPSPASALPSGMSSREGSAAPPRRTGEGSNVRSRWWSLRGSRRRRRTRAASSEGAARRSPTVHDRRCPPRPREWCEARRLAPTRFHGHVGCHRPRARDAARDRLGARAHEKRGPGAPCSMHGRVRPSRNDADVGLYRAGATPALIDRGK